MRELWLGAAAAALVLVSVVSMTPEARPRALQTKCLRRICRALAKEGQFLKMPEHAFFDMGFPLFNLIIMIDVLEVM